MPKEMHRSLEARARKMGLKGERKDAYVYGTMRKVEGMHKKKGKKKSMMNGGGYGK
jgi:hypothetical protein